MDLNQLTRIINDKNFTQKTFSAYNFGCRVNAAEINLLSQILLNMNYSPFLQRETIATRGRKVRDFNHSESTTTPSVLLVNTCSITKKGEIESLGKIRHLSSQFPDSLIVATGCARLSKVKDLSNVIIFDNPSKEEILSDLNCAYTPQIDDKFSHTHRYLLKIQSGCTQFCSYCTVPYRRQYLWSLPIDKAIDTVNQAIKNGYTEVIITGVNLDQYSHGFSNLLEALLTQTQIKLISFGSIPINCIDDKFLSLLTAFSHRLSTFLHIPIQSGSDKILKLMNRPYDKEKIKSVFSKLKNIPLAPAISNSNSKKASPVKGRWPEAGGVLSFGTDIIVGFPGETEKDLKETYNLCQSIGFSQIHTFKYSSRPNTLAAFYHQKNPKITKEELKSRSQKIRSLVK